MTGDAAQRNASAASPPALEGSPEQRPATSEPLQHGAIEVRTR